MFRFKYPQIEKPDPEVTLDGVTTPVKFLKDKSVTIEQYQTIRADSLGWRAILPKLTQDCLIYVTNRHKANCAPDDGVTYDKTLIHCIVPELLARLEEGRGHQ